jgi:hypothetical protein
MTASGQSGSPALRASRRCDEHGSVQPRMVECRRPQQCPTDPRVYNFQYAPVKRTGLAERLKRAAKVANSM